MAKISVDIGKGLSGDDLMTPKQALECWVGLFEAFQALGIVALRLVEVITVRSAGPHFAGIKIVLLMGTGEKKERVDDGTMTNYNSEKIKVEILRIFWSLVAEQKDHYEGNLNALTGVPEISAHICKNCRIKMHKSRPGGWTTDVWTCLACFGTEPLESDWKLEPSQTARPVSGEPTDSRSVGGTIEITDVKEPLGVLAEPTCPHCGNVMEKHELMYKCPNCGHSEGID